jgi:hypothetical protein
MKHLTQEELIEHYYSEDFYKVEAELHLQACKHCSQAYDELGKLLGGIRGPEPPARSAEYGNEVWRSIQGSLAPYPKKSKVIRMPWRQFGLVAACLLLVATAFFAGRIWEHAHTKLSIAAVPSTEKTRVVLFVLGDHLDRSERLLVQLNHAGGEDADASLPLQAEARQLLTDNRLYRQSVTHANDPLLSAALDHLERVLLEVANAPGDLDSEEIARIEKEMNTEGLLFQIRVLRTKVAGQQTNMQAARKGTV